MPLGKKQEGALSGSGMGEGGGDGFSSILTGTRTALVVVVRIGVTVGGISQ